MPIAITPEQQAWQESITAAAGRSDTSAIRAREPSAEPAEPGADSSQWEALAEIGLFSVALSEECGGAGGSIADLAAGLEQAAGVLAPGPVLSTVLAGLVLDQQRHVPAAKAILPRIASGEVSVAVATGTSAIVAEKTGDGGLVLSGKVDPLVAATEATHFLVPGQDAPTGNEVWFLLETGQPGVQATGRPALDFSRAVGTLALEKVAVASEAVLPGVTSAVVHDLAVTLAAAEASGIAGWCLRTAVEHARTREQFGQPIGSFQAVKHLCAGMLCRSEQATALAWDAARAADETPDEHPLAAAAAGALALDAGVETAKDCIQVLGGIGFTWEHDAHLYLRRALVLRQMCGGADVWRRRVAALALAGHRRHLDGIAELPGEAEAQRSHISEVIGEIAALPEEKRRARLAESGYLMPQWPRPYGHEAGPALGVIIDEELQRAGVQRPDLSIGGWAVPTILRYGTQDQRDRYVWQTLRGEITWCQLFSEPEAGSDLASLRTTAEKAAGGWRLTGQKVWTSVAKDADWAICLARTDPDAPKHKGLSYFLIDMASPGIDIRPLREITGEAVFNEVFLDNVFVPGDAMVGEPGDGWKLARTTLANERVAMSGSALGKTAERVLELAGDESSLPESVHESVGHQVAEGLSVSLLGARAAIRRFNGADTAAESSVQKLVGVRHRQDAAELALELLGPEAAATDGKAVEPTHEFLVSRCLSIAGGTTQILLTVAAERILGLPRGGSR